MRGRKNGTTQLLKKERNNEHKVYCSEDCLNCQLQYMGGCLGKEEKEETLIKRKDGSSFSCPYPNPHYWICRDLCHYQCYLLTVQKKETIHKEWGYYTSLVNNGSYKLKEICLYPDKEISFSRSFHRVKHWVVVEGIGKFTQGDNAAYVFEDSSYKFPGRKPINLQNIGSVTLRLIEVEWEVEP